MDISTLARSSPGMTGADIENVVNTAALRAAGEHKDKVTMADFLEAQDKVEAIPF